MGNKTSIPIQRELAPQHGGAIIPMSTTNITGVPLQREHVPQHGAVIPIRISNDTGVPVGGSQPGNTVPYKEKNGYQRPDTCKSYCSK